MSPTPAFILHNCVAHPLLPFLPQALGAKLHDSTFELVEVEDTFIYLLRKPKGKK